VCFPPKTASNFRAEPQRIRVRAYGLGYLDYDKQPACIPTNSARSDASAPALSLLSLLMDLEPEPLWSIDHRPVLSLAQRRGEAEEFPGLLLL
jgi:hypothetical protein